MTNGGIIEGRLELSGRSDLSPTTFFGSGATRMQMRKPATIRGNCRWCATPLLNLSMKYILLAVIGASVSYGQQFNGTTIDVTTGQIQVVTGFINCEQTSREIIDQDHRERVESYKRITAEMSASIDAMRREGEMQQQTDELRKQTELLRKIANE